MTIERVAPEHITVSDAETALKVTQTGSGNAFVVEDSESPDSSAFVIDNQGRVGIKKIPTQDLDVDGLIAGTNVVPGYETTTTSGGSKTLTVSSPQQQFFVGSSAHTIVLPAVGTLSLGHYYVVHNNSNNSLTINSSGGNLVLTMPQGTTAQFTCISLSGTGAASWDADTTPLSRYATTATSGGTTTLTLASADRQFFTGTQNQTVVLPAVNTLTLGQFFVIHNNSTGALTINSSGGNLVFTLPGRQTATLTAIATTGTDASVWDVDTYKSTAYETTVTSGGSKTLSVSSPTSQFFTGSSNHTVVLPVASTLTVGDNWNIHNDATGNLTVQTSGGNTLITLSAGTTITVTCVLASGTGTASWAYDFTGFNDATGSGAVVRAANPVFTANLTVDTDTFFVNSSTDRVSVGNTNPLEKFEVSGNILLNTGGSPARTTATNFIGSGDSGTTGNFRSRIGFAPDGPNGFRSAITFSNLNGDLFNSAMTERVRISGLGNLGISNADPQVRLHISGSTMVGGIYVEDSSTSNSSPGIRVKGKRSDANGSASFSGKLSLERDGGANLTQNNVSLGTLVFGGNFDISGGMAYSSCIQGVSEGAWTGSSDAPSGIIFRTGTTGATSLDTAGVTYGTERVRITSGGLVQINTNGSAANPNTVHLDVIGTDATTSIETADTFYLGRRSVTSVKNANTAGFSVGSFETGISGRTRLDIKLSGGPGAGNSFGRVPDVTVMTLNANGRVGIGTATPGFNLEVNGSFAATTKSFDIKHPTKDGHRLQHGSLEGPENGVYVRGKGKVGAPVELPDYWTGLVDGDSITVQVTPIGTSATLYVADISNNTVTISGGEEGVEFFYFIQAERVDVDKLVVEYAN
jgi:hypothetical protein